MKCEMCIIMKANFDVKESHTWTSKCGECGHQMKYFNLKYCCHKCGHILEV